VPSDAVLRAAALTFEAAGDLQRLRLLVALTRSDQTVIELAATLSRAPSLISQQLRVLRRARLVHGKREGRFVRYRPAALALLLLTRAARADEEEVHVIGESRLASRGAGDHDIEVGKLALVPRTDAAALLRLAPGTFLTNEGGTGHPYQIFLRGFDAREGQDVEFTVGGVPINEVGNAHGNGLADTHFIIPELVHRLRVVEGSFAPQQGNFAVAGSASYDLGLDDPGLSARVTAGSFGTKRLLLTWKPTDSRLHTFGGAEVFSSDGYGQNRQSDRATAMGGYEGVLGKSGLWRVLVTSYATHYGSAGVLRDDDVKSGRKGFYDTYDRSQGGDSSRHSAAFTLEDRFGDIRVSQSAFAVLRDFRIRENPTGYALDPQETWQTPHGQRGDLIDQRSETVTAGARGSARGRWDNQELEVGYVARHDLVSSVQQRDRAGTTTPYANDLDLDSALTNLGLYADAGVHPFTRWLTLRGGGRVDFYAYRVHDHCALRTQSALGAATPDAECFDEDRSGHRSLDQTTSTSVAVWEPRATAIFGPFEGFSLSASAGKGTRSIDPQYVNQDLRSPFAEVVATEGGVAYARSLGTIDLSARSTFFSTHVDRDLFFNASEGRATGGPSRRWRALRRAAVRPRRQRRGRRFLRRRASPALRRALGRHLHDRRRGESALAAYPSRPDLHESAQSRISNCRIQLRIRFS
jgi:DNA-binding transcriptional ArsR family regulator